MTGRFNFIYIYCVSCRTNLNVPVDQKEIEMLRPVKFSATLITLSCWTLQVSSVCGVDDHRVEVEIEKEVKIVPAGVAKRAMMSMVRHPDGTIFLNAQTESPRLYKSSDNGKTWSAAPVKLTGAPPNQSVQGLGVSRCGRLFVNHVTKAPAVDGLYGQSLFVSYSDDGGRTWETFSFNFGQAVKPGLPNMMFHKDGNRTFIEQPNGTLMFTTTIVPSPKYREQYLAQQPYGPPSYEYGGQHGDLFSDVIFRSTDGGATWGDPSQVYSDL